MEPLGECQLSSHTGHPTFRVECGSYEDPFPMNVLAQLGVLTPFRESVSEVTEIVSGCRPGEEIADIF